MTKDEALKLALEALVCLKKDFDADQFEWEIADEAITAIKAALAQPEQDPVASIFISGIGEREFDDWGHNLPVGRNLLYTTPPQRKPLSDEEIYSLADSLEIWNEDDEEWILDPNTFARAIEAAHGIGGEA
jgi:hypothetical protein